MGSLRPYQEASSARLETILRTYEGAADLSDMGCHALGTRVLLYDGESCPVEEVRVGTQLLGPDSYPRTVLQLKRGFSEKPLVEVVPIKGNSFICNREHVLTLVNSETRKGPQGVFDVSIEEFLKFHKTLQTTLKLFRRPAVAHWKDSTLLLDPYFLGVFLGDGSFSYGNVAVSKPDPEIRALCFEQARVWGARIKEEGTPNNPSFFFREAHILRTALGLLGLRDVQCGGKFVPTEYLRGSRETRSQVLAGLLDTDGSLVNNGYDFISKSQELSQGVVFLARSLGLAAYLRPCHKGCQTGAVGEYFRVSISGDCSGLPLRIPRKKAAPRRQAKDVLRTGFTIRDLQPGDFYGFTLTGDGRYCLEDFTVTHNTGKTFVACDLIRKFDRPTLVVCPKVSIDAWKHVGGLMGAEFSILNWEMLRTGRTPYGKLEKIGKGSRFTWAPEIKQMVFDEAHVAGGLTTLNSKMVSATYRQRIPTLLMTATPAESPLQLKAMGCVLGLHQGVNFWNWARNHGCYNGNFGGLKFTENAERAKHFMARIHEAWAPRVSRIRIEDLGDQFPEVIYDAPILTLDTAAEIEKLYGEAQEAYEAIRTKQAAGGSEEHPMVQFLRARQKIELLKIPGWIELANEALHNGKTVLFFVNFSATIAALKEVFPDAGIIDGQTKDRTGVIRAIQEDRCRVGILNNEAGGVSISVHDITGKHPRYSIVSPTVRTKSFIQVLGRTRRDGSKSTPHIVIPVVAGTCEVKIKKRIDMRTANIETLCGDLFE